MSIKKDEIKISQPHKKVSRPATDKDCDLIMSLAAPMMSLCANLIKDKVFDDICALHHSQITTKPLDFFVLNPYSPKHGELFSLRDNRIFVNVKIINHTSHTVTKYEGCVSFPGRADARAERWHKIVCEFQYPVRQDDGRFALSQIQTEDMAGLMAQIIQHEFDHSKGIFVYSLK